MNQYIVPANSKKSRLIFGWFVWLDLIVLGTGIGLSIISWLIISGLNKSTLGNMLIGAIPMGISFLLILQIPYYHNVRQYLTNLFLFITGKRKYYWKGWCVKDDEQ